MDHPAETEDIVASARPATSIFTMEAREGRVGNAFACERCRKHKVRCVPSETSGVCQRCQKARVECIEHVARRRPAKPRTDGQSTNKMRDLDKKLEKLSAIVATMAPMAPSPTQSTLPSLATVSSQYTEHSQQTPTPPAEPTICRLSISRTPILQTPVPKSENSLPFWESMNATLSGLGRLDPVIRSISVVHMQMLLETYRAMVNFFPFVPLPKDYIFQDLTQDRPMLMFAILTVASHDSVLLQLMLSREFRKVIMVKIMNGEKSLDLLQALLVFVAWHHRYMDAQAVSIPMLLQLCIGMANDLGLDSIPQPVHGQSPGEDPRDREAKRAYLGCYYLASNIGMMESRKARPMQFSATLGRYAYELASSAETDSDAVISSLIDVCQLTEDIEETFSHQPEQALVARTQVKRLSEKCDNMQSMSKQQAGQFKILHWLQLAARVFLYQRTSSLELADREATPWAAGFQLSLRVSYLRSIEHFLDTSMKLTTSQFEFLSLVDWLNLVSTTISLSKLALYSTPIPGWDPCELQIARSFEYFRDQLASQMPPPRDAQDSNEDVFDRFRRITAGMKVAVCNTPRRDSPNSGTFELATGSGRTVSLLQDLPLPKPNGMVNGAEMLPSLWKGSPAFDITSTEFHWRFLTGTV